MFMRFGLVAGLLELTVVAVSGAAGVIARDQLDVLHDLIKPKTAETGWARIPWMMEVWAARKKAAAEGKPILLWEMDGHPLGCT